MGFPNEINSLMIGDINYQVSRSLRFRSSAGGHMTRTPGSASNRRTWTFSSWVKRGTLTTESPIFCARISDTDRVFIGFDGTTDQLQIFANPSAGINVVTPGVLRDPTAWYHVIVSFDTTQATSTNRVRMWVNGVQQTVTGTFPNQNTDWAINSTNPHLVARTSPTTATYFDGYLAETYFIDGQALTASSFGVTDPTTGVWKPVRYIGTYGTNGFYLPFTDNSGATATTIGRDFSGNGNNYTPTNISVTAGSTFDSMLDSPTSYADGGNGRGNYCVLDRLNLVGNSGSTWGSTSDGNLIATTATLSGSGVSATMAVNIPAGQRWYWEVTPTSGVTTSADACVIGVIERTVADGIGGPIIYVYNSSDAVTYTNNDVIGCAYDGTTSTLFFYKNNVLAKTVTGVSSSFPLLPFIRDNIGTSITARFNFGQQPFVYTPPAGYRALNTQNIPTPTILDGRRYMTATTYTGTGSSQTISNGRFYPDLVWIKSRSAATSHELTDSVRGATRSVATNSDAAETIDANGVVAFTSTGFTIGTDSNYNNNATTYVAWQWNANSGSSSSNSAGTITSTVSVNQLAGFSIVTYTGANSNGTSTVGHGLGVAPRLVLVKNRGATGNWIMGHSSIPNAMMRVNTNEAQVTANVTLAANAFTSSTFSVTSISAGVAGDNLNNLSNTYVAYCFTPVAGFSAFGSYIGNANTDGPMVWCGFRPSFVFVKNIGISSIWATYDSTRNPTNLANFTLRLTGTEVEFTGVPAGNEPIDLLSNGFKLRGTGGSGNANGNTFIYAAFAESPFKYSLAR